MAVGLYRVWPRGPCNSAPPQNFKSLSVLKVLGSIASNFLSPYCKKINKTTIVYLLHLRILCFPRSGISYQEILHPWETRYIRYLIWCLGFSLYIMFLVWCLENHLCVLSISILIRLGYIGTPVWNLKLSWIKIQYKWCCLFTFG